MIKIGLIPRGKTFSPSEETDSQCSSLRSEEKTDLEDVPRRSGQTQNRSVQKHLEIVSQYRRLVQFKACSDKGIAILSNLPNLQHAQKDVLITDSRKSDDRESEVHQHNGACGSHCVDFRIPGIPHSAVEQVETNRKERVRRLIEQFESHPKRNMLSKDFEKSEINHFSQEFKDLITEMGNNEIFEFYETSSKRQCPDCAAY